MEEDAAPPSPPESGGERKVREWALAVVLMVFLAMILYMLVSFFRSGSL